MSVVEPIPGEALQVPEPEIDRMLRGFFRSELPNSWSAPAVAAPFTPALHSTRTLTRGRWALAASLALILCGQILVSRFSSSDAPPTTRSGGPAIDIANRPHKKAPTTSRNRGPESLKPPIERPAPPPR
jgi:hypothetical protein